jgi:glucuronosyltransferase
MYYVSRYKSSVNRHADIWRDQPVTPAEEMRYWLELLVKYKNLDHLRIHDDHLNLLQYLCIDVIAFLTAIVLLCIFALFQCLVWARRKSLGDVPMKNDKKTL